MIIKVSDGNTVRGMRPFTNKAALGHLLDSIEVGAHVDIERFVRIDGKTEGNLALQMAIGYSKHSDAKYKSCTMPCGSLRIFRLA